MLRLLDMAAIRNNQPQPSYELMSQQEFKQIGQ